ncbi:hypothetical protein E2C01_056044 [Portunus trituberculatus]|uniref:Uncharacterized protein n=1 Tax=Portunus trituberculatus TaxID=210409 RepID=A0A5B7GX56_PORTR|nr:hypothetical protein [Portunus trituberculatus]
MEIKKKEREGGLMKSLSRHLETPPQDSSDLLLLLPPFLPLTHFVPHSTPALTPFKPLPLLWNPHLSLTHSPGSIESRLICKP